MAWLSPVEASFLYVDLLQTVQRAESWVVILALQSDAVDLEVDNLNVVRQVGRLVDGFLEFLPC